MVSGYVWAGDGALWSPRQLRQVVTTEANVVEIDLGEEVIRCGRSHPFFSGEWLAAGALVAGACVLRRDGSWQQIHGVRDGGRARVYELTLAELHVYFVGAVELCVRDVQRAPAVRHAALHHPGM
ncbi:MAG: polymorphic toxin-type HINT domain-containing protein [Kofleriaceae bacterium]